MTPVLAEFRDRHVVVTGATGALGRVVAAQLLEAGAVCHLPVRGKATAFDGVARARVAHGVDLSDAAAVQKFYAGIPRLWASIHAAGGFAFGPVATLEDKTLHDLLAMNFISCALCCRAAIGGMKAGGGRIVNVTARAGVDWRRGSGMAAYAASKAAVAAFTVALAGEVKNDGILVNAVAPSIIDTPANRRDMPDADFSAWPTAEEISAAILALATPSNVAASGDIVPIYGRA
jgi:NAD(P)-dependent dehydrogenase (short-subunit alcohol dehydrogenase family)